jgi:hypothetical protein
MRTIVDMLREADGDKNKLLVSQAFDLGRYGGREKFEAARAKCPTSEYVEITGGIFQKNGFDQHEIKPQVVAFRVLPGEAYFVLSVTLGSDVLGSRRLVAHVPYSIVKDAYPSASNILQLVLDATVIIEGDELIVRTR